MALKKVSREEYERAKASVPEHDGRVVEQRKPRRLYYTSQKVFDEGGRLVAMHDEDGAYYADDKRG